MAFHCLLHDFGAAFLFISPSSTMSSGRFDILHIPASKRRRNDLMHLSRTLMPEFEFYLSIPFFAPIANMPIAENGDFLKSFISSNRSFYIIASPFAYVVQISQKPFLFVVVQSKPGYLANK